MNAESLDDKVRRLLYLLYEVEDEFEPAYLEDPELGTDLVDRLQAVARTVNERLDSAESVARTVNEHLDSAESVARTVNERLDSAESVARTVNERLDSAESLAERPPFTHLVIDLTAGVPEVRLVDEPSALGGREPSQIPAYGTGSAQFPSRRTYDELVHPPRLDEQARKRRREAEEMVKSMKPTKSFACGCSYQDGEEERSFSNDSKKKIKELLPALKTNKPLFHFMVFATLDRLECEHCRQCPNVFEAPT